MASPSDIDEIANAYMKDILQNQQNVNHYEHGRWGKTNI